MVNAATGGSPPQAESIRAALEIKAPRKTCENFDLNDIFFFLLKKYYLLILLQNYFKTFSGIGVSIVTLFAPQKRKSLQTTK
jgi:hypothetical protein